jgi:hypothetical protein
MGIFTAVLPVFATWVGTVIAFYFTNESFRQAAQSIRETTGTVESQVNVTDVMISYDKIAKIEKKRAEVRQISMQDVVRLLNDQITRVLVFDESKTPVFVIRKKRIPPEWLGADNHLTAEGQGKTIDDYLKGMNNENAKDATQYGFVPEGASVATARTQMLNAKCVDLFVTKSGQKTDPVLGWLSDDTLK